MRQHLSSFINCSAPLAALAASLLARRRWSFVAGACLIAAVALWIASGVTAAFVAATLGVVAWFWDERARLRPVAAEAERQRLLALEAEENEGGGEVEEFNGYDAGEPGDDAAGIGRGASEVNTNEAGGGEEREGQVGR